MLLFLMSFLSTITRRQLESYLWTYAAIFFFTAESMLNVFETITIFIRYEIHTKYLLVESGRQSPFTSSIL